MMRQAGRSGITNAKWRRRRVHPFQLKSITAGGDRAVLRIEGDIDAYAAPQLLDRVIDMAAGGIIHIIADLRGTVFLDSAGLGALVGSRKELRGRGGSFTLVASAHRILQTFRIAGLSNAFSLHSCLPDAIAADQHWQAAVSGEGGGGGGGGEGQGRGGSAEEWCRRHGLLLASRIRVRQDSR
jgi:anti-sigma B factor antagonist